MAFLNRRDSSPNPYEPDFVGAPETERPSETSSEPAHEIDSWWRAKSYGEPTTFGAQPWHTERNWWKVPASGEANDIRSQFSTLGRLACAATSLRGNKHRLQGEVNQDSFSVVTATSKNGDSFLVIAVCDGMGSAKYSSFAARIAAAECSASLARGVSSRGLDMFPVLEERQSDFIGRLREKILGYRDGEFDAPPIPAEEADPKELQTTLSFAVVGPANAEEALVVSGWVGDSPVILIQDQNWLYVSREQEGDGLHSTASQGLMTSDQLMIRYDNLLPNDALLVCSDGVGNFIEYKGTETALGSHLRESWAAPPERLEFVRDLSFDIQSADDDRTAVVVWHR